MKIKDFILRSAILLIILSIRPFSFFLRRGNISEQPKDFVYDID